MLQVADLERKAAALQQSRDDELGTVVTLEHRLETCRADRAAARFSTLPYLALPQVGSGALQDRGGGRAGRHVGLQGGPAAHGEGVGGQARGRTALCRPAL